MRDVRILIVGATPLLRGQGLYFLWKGKRNKQHFRTDLQSISLIHFLSIQLMHPCTFPSGFAAVRTVYTSRLITADNDWQIAVIFIHRATPVSHEQILGEKKHAEKKPLENIKIQKLQSHIKLLYCYGLSLWWCIYPIQSWILIQGCSWAIVSWDCV